MPKKRHAARSPLATASEVAVDAPGAQEPPPPPQPPPAPPPEPNILPPAEPVPAEPPAPAAAPKKRGRPKKGPPTPIEEAKKRIKKARDYLNGQVIIWNKMVERKNNDPGWEWDEPSVVAREKARLARRKAMVDKAQEALDAASRALPCAIAREADELVESAFKLVPV